jgi:hypothetical protein
VPDTFEQLYAPLLKEVFTTQAREQIAQGVDPLEAARSYAEQGKPDFALAFLLVVDIPDGEKRDLLARAYEQRATLSEQKAEQFQAQFHRPFPMIKLEAQKDRLAAQAVRQGKRVRVSTTKIPPIQ